jgi:nucleoside-diphosphate-sugar epimerase
MKVLVTGATGFVGRHAVHCLLERGHEVTAVGRDPAKARALDWREAPSFIARDIHASPPDPQWSRHDAVMHLAWPGLPHYDNPAHLERTLDADYEFIEALVGNGLRHLLVSGTCLEYGLRDGPMREGDETAPQNPYAQAKDTLRKRLQALRARRPFTLQWARLFYMHGPGQNPNSLLARLDRAAADGSASFDMSPGDQLRDYLPVEQVASRLVTLLEHPQLDGITNVCSGKPITVRALAEERLRALGSGLKLNLGALPYQGHEPMAFWGDPSRLATVMGSHA